MEYHGRLSAGGRGRIIDSVIDFSGRAGFVRDIRPVHLDGIRIQIEELGQRIRHSRSRGQRLIPGVDLNCPLDLLIGRIVFAAFINPVHRYIDRTVVGRIFCNVFSPQLRLVGQLDSIFIRFVNIVGNVGSINDFCVCIRGDVAKVKFNFTVIQLYIIRCCRTAFADRLRSFFPDLQGSIPRKILIVSGGIGNDRSRQARVITVVSGMNRHRPSNAGVLGITAVLFDGGVFHGINRFHGNRNGVPLHVEYDILIGRIFARCSAKRGFHIKIAATGLMRCRIFIKRKGYRLIVIYLISTQLSNIPRFTLKVVGNG